MKKTILEKDQKDKSHSERNKDRQIANVDKGALLRQQVTQ